MNKLFVLFVILFLKYPVFSQQDIFEVARKGTVEELNQLLKDNPELLHAVNESGYNLITLATYRNNNAVAALLIEKGADINGKSNYGTPLMAAVVKGNSEIAKRLIEAGADLNVADASGNTALIYAVNFKKYEIATMLVKASAKLDLKDIRGNSALDYAKILNDQKLLEILKTDKL